MQPNMNLRNKILVFGFFSPVVSTVCFVLNKILGSQTAFLEIGGWFFLLSILTTIAVGIQGSSKTQDVRKEVNIIVVGFLIYILLIVPLLIL